MSTIKYSEQIKSLTLRWPVGRSVKEGMVLYASSLEERGLPVIFDLKHIAWHTGIEPRLISNIVLDAKRYYRSHSIPKRRGGSRTIQMPRPYLSALQRWVLDNILGVFPVHLSAKAFFVGSTIVGNAGPHAKSNCLLKIDLKDFFGSIKYEDVYALFSGLGYSPKVSYYLSRICTLEGSLPQGAPTSPSISNIVMMAVDDEILQFSSDNELIYTRYADDICLSGAEIPDLCFSFLSDVLDRNGFEISKEKTVLSRKGEKKIVTGISISSGVLKIPRDLRRRLRQEIFHIKNNGWEDHLRARGITDPIYRYRLKGLIEFWLSVEPNNSFAKLGLNLIKLGLR